MPRFNHQWWLFPSYHVDLDSDIKWLYAIRLLRDCTERLAFFFLPIFLFQHAPSLRSWLGTSYTTGLSDVQLGMLAVAGFYALLRLWVLLLLAPITKIITNLGIRVGLAISLACLCLVLAGLVLADANPVILILLPPFYALQLILFWLIHDVLFAQVAAKKHMGQDLGALQFVLELVSIFIPALGGFLVYTVGYGVVFIIAAGLVGLAFSLSLLMQAKLPVAPWSWQIFWKDVKQPRIQQQAFSAIARYVNDGLLIIWPLYVLALVGRVDRVGFLYTFSLFLSLIVVYFAGLHADRDRTQRGFWMSAGLLSGVWLTRAAVFSGWGIAVVDTCNKLISSFHWLYFDAKLLSSFRGNRGLQLAALKEVVISVAAIVLWLSVGILFVVTNRAWEVLFVVAAVAVLVSVMVKERIEN